MARAIRGDVTLKLSWPRPEGEVPLWVDLCLARALKASVGQPLHPSHLAGTHDRIQFEEWTPAASVSGRSGPVMKVGCDLDADWDLDLVGTCNGRRLQWRKEFINADVDLDAVADKIVITRSGRLCLYGPPGSGKSAYAQHLSERIGAPLLVRRASDLIDKYIGETEKNLAMAFQRAKDESAVLLIDEADSFLQDRQRAQRSWEISHVNELLTQMERFEGVLIMCTNLFDQLDAAALRRFDIKVKLSYLRTDQRAALFDDCVTRYGIATPALQQQLATERLSRLDRLTPGDFQTVLRRRRLVGAGDALSFVEALAGSRRGSAMARVGRLGSCERTDPALRTT